MLNTWINIGKSQIYKDKNFINNLLTIFFVVGDSDSGFLIKH